MYHKVHSNAARTFGYAAMQASHGLPASPTQFWPLGALGDPVTPKVGGEVSLLKDSQAIHWYVYQSEWAPERRMTSLCVDIWARPGQIPLFLFLRRPGSWFPIK